MIEMEILTHADDDFYTYEVRACGRTFFVSCMSDGTWFVYGGVLTLGRGLGRFPTVSAAIAALEAYLASAA